MKKIIISILISSVIAGCNSGSDEQIISNSLRSTSIDKQQQRNPSDFAKMNSFAKINQLGIIMP